MPPPLLVSCCIFALFTLVATRIHYNVEAKRDSHLPIISWTGHTSTFQQPFNPSWVEASPGTSGKSGLLIRAQNCDAHPGGPCVHCGGGGEAASVVAFSENKNGHFTPINKDSIVFGPFDASDTHGTEDPRIQYNKEDGLYYMFYTAYNRSHALLSLATTRDPTSPKGWKRHGPVFPQVAGRTKSGALLLRQKPPHYLLWGDSHIRIAKSDNPAVWHDPGRILLESRRGSWDSELVESGPPPFQLSTGDYVFFYNGATTGNMTYHAAWIILDGKDPTKVLQRAKVPMLSPKLSWEVGIHPYTCNVKNVIFLEAAQQLEGKDTFRVYYGAADVAIGSALVTVTYTSSKGEVTPEKDGLCTISNLFCVPGFFMILLGFALALAVRNKFTRVTEKDQRLNL